MYSEGKNLPKVSCLMVTADRPDLCRRAIRCYNRQTYKNKELVVVDDGETDLATVLSEVPDDELTYLRLPGSSNYVLGKLRNIALDTASGDIFTQWDDDEWYHPERIEKQVEVLLEGYEACCLQATLMHISDKEFFAHPYIGLLKKGVPGSIMHFASEDIRYPELKRAEDSIYLDKWLQKDYTTLSTNQAYLFIRCFHGENTWEKEHFLTRMRNTIPDTLSYLWYRFVRRNIFLHPRFNLENKAREAFQLYLEDSKELELLETTSS